MSTKANTENSIAGMFLQSSTFFDISMDLPNKRRTEKSLEVHLMFQNFFSCYEKWQTLESLVGKVCQSKYQVGVT